jgi:nitrogen-specific signal transduction histidine kinase
LRDNLEKVVQHGKRADAIVKNMLLHSQQGSGEYRAVDINTIVEESLNIAYQAARAEKQGFKVTLERSFDPAAGELDLFPQEITRVLLNLISNGFYAVTKRKEFSLLICVGNRGRSGCSVAVSCFEIGAGSPEIAKFPVKFPVSREFGWRRVRSALPPQPVFMQ